MEASRNPIDSKGVEDDSSETNKTVFFLYFLFFILKFTSHHRKHGQFAIGATESLFISVV